ncbi:MAG: phage terminase large subunit family protein [Inquilinaceae bacterium]
MADAVADTAAWADGVWRRGLRPEPALTVSAWADRHRVLSQRASAEPGRWRTERTPYLAEIMDALSPSHPAERVVFMKGSQVGGSEAGNNWLGYIIGQAPGPAMAVLPTVELAKRTSRQRIDPLIEESPALRRLVRPARARDSGNSLLSKEFPGGVLILTGANSAVGLRSMPARYLFLDEIDAYPPDADGEGDPIELAVKRTVTFARRKIFMVSTPTVAGVSRIEVAFAESDQRQYFVPCPDCGTFQTLKWPQVQWTSIGVPPAKAEYCCEACGALIPNHAKAAMLAAGEWRATAAGDGKTVGFHLSALYSPPGWYSWGQAAADFVAAGRNPARLKVFVNTVLGECFVDEGEAPDWQRLHDRREGYPVGTVPTGGLYLTAGADVQKDRIEVEIVAWGRGRENWSVDHRILEGNPLQPAVWRQLTALLDETFPHASGGRLAVGRLAIDTGYLANEVYGWCSRQAPGRVLAVKGVDRNDLALGAPTMVDFTRSGRRIKRGVRLWPVGASMLKSQLYGWLQQDPAGKGEPAPEGWCHFPRYGEEYFKQLTAERLVQRRTRTGFARQEWTLTRDRNEALDLRVYAMAAAVAARLDRWTEADWTQREFEAGFAAPADPAPARPAVVKSKWLEG